ncbi:sigma factor G inhibitor Gin [Bacillus haikouensis]|uniref:sigma factor G inhibitor Gin n=1 Tax=Bacillus haikouensis TaxID=1510468 RepID=UPI001553755C|nr:sigma factor G inhibitor Gin [Bacillus haikouensis]NQD67911.1 sigma factor G inhibitor Gin [Bacillus haikouensis]
MEVEIRMVNAGSEPVCEQCIVCQSEKSVGIHLYTSFICTECEREMVQTETNEPVYKLFIQRLKKVNTPQIYS